MAETGHFTSCANPSDCWCEAKRYGQLVLIGAVIFTIEIIGNLLSGSLSLLADALHVVVCNTSYAVAAFAAIAAKLQRVSKEKAEGGAFCVLAVGLLLTALWILFEAMSRFKNPPEIASTLVIGTALIGGALNHWQQRIHHKAPEEHRGHKHAAAGIHILSDKYQSFVVAGSGVGMLIASHWWSEWPRYIDPAVSIVLACWLGWQVVVLGKDFLKEPEHHH
ncbi:hypothetical protein A2671_02590 [Candidatus Kaiserbacteria bacterium RIFCSPHIGHO2_01_FULL_49_13]|uniref:Cation efflux protein transmembrane domain-containing protein n=1 Tax=Candidatus Kaiserbacteria bacterium RIFCSPHIGHO2_01_FULL_49_13 TaxID=1798477 RepID=A0A1F6CCS6_9BACT|nr:MAG: hypothetical protein A2671_02590 [Candidatus Kaiserbacteria bacterium RIFCSPHIGHO2_01_FULL_49_13]